jgi:hypothetical protein
LWKSQSPSQRIKIEQGNKTLTEIVFDGGLFQKDASFTLDGKKYAVKIAEEIEVLASGKAVAVGSRGFFLGLPCIAMEKGLSDETKVLLSLITLLGPGRF